MKKVPAHKQRVFSGKSAKYSKTLYFNLITTVAEIALVLADVLPHDRYPEIITVFIVINGIGNSILRIWFTDTYIREGKKIIDN